MTAICNQLEWISECSKLVTPKTHWKPPPKLPCLDLESIMSSGRVPTIRLVLHMIQLRVLDISIINNYDSQLYNLLMFIF